jgi:hypothetical protein
MKGDQSTHDIQHLSILEFVARDLPPGDWDVGIDDSDVPIKVVIDNFVNEVVLECYTANSTGGFEAKGNGDSFGDNAPEEINVIDDGKKELGHGKRSKQANRLYFDFWRHDSGTSDKED